MGDVRGRCDPARGGSRQQPAVAALTILAGLSFVGAGLVAWRSRPERLTGALMVATGFALFAGTLVDANRSVPFTVGLP